MECFVVNRQSRLLVDITQRFGGDSRVYLKHWDTCRFVCRLCDSFWWVCVVTAVLSCLAAISTLYTAPSTQPCTVATRSALLPPHASLWLFHQYFLPSLCMQPTKWFPSSGNICFLTRFLFISFVLCTDWLSCTPFSSLQIAGFTNLVFDGILLVTPCVVNRCVCIWIFWQLLTMCPSGTSGDCPDCASAHLVGFNDDSCNGLSNKVHSPLISYLQNILSFPYRPSPQYWYVLWHSHTVGAPLGVTLYRLNSHC